jgi:5-(carboxyamino)imidazole ribonucleotide mutase
MKTVMFVLGSASDLPQMEGAFQILDSLAVAFGVRILSAHRTPDETLEFARSAEGEGARVLIAAAGLAAALPGVVAAHSRLPVIGVPIAGQALGGIDALYSIAQMPAGVPVACMGIGSHGARNAALLAARILALSDSALGDRLSDLVAKKAEEVRKEDAAARSRFES